MQAATIIERVAAAESIYWVAYWQYRKQGFNPETANRLALVASAKRGDEK